VDLRADLDAVEYRKHSFPCRESNSAVQPVAIYNEKGTWKDTRGYSSSQINVANYSRIFVESLRKTENNNSIRIGGITTEIRTGLLYDAVSRWNI
jgi:hypothetical protein